MLFKTSNDLLKHLIRSEQLSSIEVENEFMGTNLTYFPEIKDLILKKWLDNYFHNYCTIDGIYSFYLYRNGSISMSMNGGSDFGDHSQKVGDQILKFIFDLLNEKIGGKLDTNELYCHLEASYDNNISKMSVIKNLKIEDWSGDDNLDDINRIIQTKFFIKEIQLHILKCVKDFYYFDKLTEFTVKIEENRASISCFGYSKELLTSEDIKFMLEEYK